MIQDIFKQFYKDYLFNYMPTYNRKKVLNHILNCKTKNMGTSMYRCNKCGKISFTYNSCQDRHCPHCDEYKKEKWIESQKNNFLNVKYYHLVFPVPHEAYILFYHNQEIAYNLLFQITYQTIQKIYQDNIPAVMSVLHTWNGKGDYHPHIHMIISTGGFNSLNKYIKKKINQRIVNKIYKAEFIKTFLKNQLTFFNNYSYLNEFDEYAKYINNLKNKNFKAYLKKPFKNVFSAYKYLGRYVNKVWLSNDKIVKVTNEKVSFLYFNRQKGRDELFTIPGTEFIRRYLMHVLPKNFMKIRYYGLLAGKNKNSRLQKIKKLTHTFKLKILNKQEILIKINDNKNIVKCECSGTFVLIKKTKPPSIKIFCENVYEA